jgi:hypothetical protein
MYDLTDPDNDYNYAPNDLAHLSIWHREKYERIVNSNLKEGDTIEQWQQRNLEYAQKHLRQQREAG